tara:strand:- start:663 stop:1838 length:1176 start_codon:yes stop_codon:yes gene_type:complete
MKLIKNNFPKWPYFTNKEIVEVSKLLRSGKVNYRNGIYSKKFEDKFSKYIGTKYGIGLFNGSVAIELALRAIGIESGDEIIVTPRSFIISSSIPILFNAKPIFADIDENTLGLTLNSIKKVFSKKTKAIIAVHLGGTPCDIVEISKFAKKNNISLIEDCSQAHGASINKKKVGSFGRISTFSFCKDKIISTGGEGGMILTNEKKLFRKIYEYKDHGKNINQQKNFLLKYNYIHNSYGSNYRITEFQSCLGIIQLEKLNKNLDKRNNLVKSIYKITSKYPEVIRLPIINANNYNAFYVCYLFLKKDGIKKGINLIKVISYLRKLGIESTIGACPELYKEKVFKNYVSKKFYLKNARKLSTETLCLNINHNFTKKYLNIYLKNLENVLKNIKK